MTFETTDLFEARTGGYYNYRVPGIVTAPDGTLLVYCDARKGKGGDWDPIDIHLRRSLDGGKTWEPAQVVVDHAQFEQGGINNFVLIPDRVSGEVHALFCCNYESLYAMKSTDSGQTFTPPVEITSVFDAFRAEYNWKAGATGPGHGIQLRSGRLIVPVWLSTGEGHGGHRPSIVSVIYSDDHGANWQRGDIIVRHDEMVINPSETVPVELSDGRVLFNIRNESPQLRRLISISPNGIDQWSAPVFDGALLEPQCMGSILRLKHTDDAILFANPDNLEQTLPGLWQRAYDRKNLTLKLSQDDCQTWVASKVIEVGPSGYSDLAEADDGSVVCVYERGFVTGMADTQYITVARFDPGWIAHSQDE